MFVYLMCGPRQLFFQRGSETPKGWAPLQCRTLKLSDVLKTAEDSLASFFYTRLTFLVVFPIPLVILEFDKKLLPENKLYFGKHYFGFVKGQGK